MKKYNEKLISKLIIVAPTLLITIAMIAAAAILINSKYDAFEAQKKMLTKEYIAQEQMYQLFEFIENISTVNRNKSDAEIKKILIEMIGNNTQKNIFIYELIDSGGGNPGLVHQYITDNQKDVYGKTHLKDMLMGIVQNGEAFISYKYKDPKSNAIDNRIAYFKQFPKWHWIIGAEVSLNWIDTLMREKEEALKETIVQEIYSILILTVVLLIFVAAVSFFIAKNVEAIFKLYQRKIIRKNIMLKQQLYMDEITQLKNRKALLENIEQSEGSVLFLIDIDDFGMINELYGIQAGNLVLQYVAKKLKKFARQHHYEVYKIGSDEFVLYQTEYLVDLIEIRNTLFNLKNNFSDISIPLPHIETDAMVDITTGVSFEEESLLETADIALKYAKSHKKHFMIYNSSIENTQEIQNMQQWIKEIKQALAEDRVRPFFQGIADTRGNIVKYESLIRILKYEKEETLIITPFHFLEIAFKTKLYPRLMKQMIKKSFAVFSKREEPFSVNLAISDISDPEMVVFIKEQMKHYQVSDRVIFEIVEDESIHDFEIVKKFVDEMHAQNAKIAIDDFGSGYSNFSNILILNPDYLKIDGSLIKNIDTDPKSKVLVKTIVLFAKELGIKTIAEFVSSKEIFEICKSLGIDEFQGFYFSTPQPLEIKEAASIQV